MNEELNENTVGNWFQDNTNLEVYTKDIGIKMKIFNC